LLSRLGDAPLARPGRDTAALAIMGWPTLARAECGLPGAEHNPSGRSAICFAPPDA